MWISSDSDMHGYTRQERLPKGTIGLSDNSNNSLFLPPTRLTINATGDSKHRLGMLSELDYENVFFAEQDTEKYVTPPPKEGLRKASTSWIKKAATIATVAAFSISATMNNVLPKASKAILPQASILNPSATTPLAKETRLDNGVMVYGDAQATTALSDLVTEFPTIWQDEGFVKLPQDDWMKITLRDDWQSRLPSGNRAKIYPLGIKDREVIDKTFDEMHRQG